MGGSWGWDYFVPVFLSADHTTAHRLQSDHVMRHQVMIYGWKAGNRYWLNFQNRFWGLKRELNGRLCVVSNSRFSLLPPCENDKKNHIYTLIMCSLFTGPLIHKKKLHIKPLRGWVNASSSPEFPAAASPPSRQHICIFFRWAEPQMNVNDQYSS